MIRFIGYACVNQTLRGKGKNQVFTSRGLTLRTFDKARASALALQNCNDLLTILKWNAENNIKFFRISSEFFPFATHPDVGYRIHDLADYSAIVSSLSEAGRFAKANGMRLNSHPGPTTLLASPNPVVIESAIRDLQMHLDVYELLSPIDEPFNINFHIGGPYGDRVGTAARFCENFKKLNPRIQSVISIENDDKASQFSVKDLYDMVYVNTGVPIVFDYHHHTFNTGGLSHEDAAKLAFSTWGDKTPEMHYSEPRDEKTPTAHADYIVKQLPDLYDKPFDIMVEAKEKELALLNYRKLFA